MWRRVIVPGLLGGIVMVVWMFLVNGLLGFRASIDMNRVPNERLVYEVLKDNITEPGRYVCNPAVTDSGRFPGGEPVFGILNGGMGHEAAGVMALVQLPMLFILPILAAGLLSKANRTVLSSYGRKIMFFTGLGLLIAIADTFTDFGIGGYPLGSALLSIIHDVALWIVAGLVMAWRMGPDPR